MKNPFLELKIPSHIHNYDDLPVHKKININHIISYSNTEIRMANGDSYTNKFYNFNIDLIDNIIKEYYKNE